MELFFKQLKQNFPLKYFLADNENAIEIQIWVAKGGAFRNKILTLIINKQPISMNLKCTLHEDLFFWV